MGPEMWVIYDIPNENVMYCDLDEEVTDEMCQANLIKMPYHQAERIRHAKNLPMPCPPVKVVVGDSLLADPVTVDPATPPRPGKRPKSFA